MPDFKDEEFMTAREKERVLRNWRLFLKGDFDRKHFTTSLYKHLSLHCSFIAHYDINGFYGCYWGDVTKSTFGFIDQFDPKLPGISVEYGADWWLKGTCADLNQAMREEMGRHADRLREMCKQVRMAKLESEIEKKNAELAKMREDS